MSSRWNVEVADLSESCEATKHFGVSLVPLLASLSLSLDLCKTPEQAKQNVASDRTGSEGRIFPTFAGVALVVVVESWIFHLMGPPDLRCCWLMEKAMSVKFPFKSPACSTHSCARLWLHFCPSGLLLLIVCQANPVNFPFIVHVVRRMIVDIMACLSAAERVTFMYVPNNY